MTVVNPSPPFQGGTISGSINSMAGGNAFTASNGGMISAGPMDAIGGFRASEGANAKQGLTAAMVAGTLVVANTSVTANSRIQLTRQDGGTNPGAVYVSARTAGTSFTIASTNAADTGQVAFEIFEPG